MTIPQKETQFEVRTPIVQNRTQNNYKISSKSKLKEKHEI